MILPTEAWSLSTFSSSDSWVLDLVRLAYGSGPWGFVSFESEWADMELPFWLFVSYFIACSSRVIRTAIYKLLMLCPTSAIVSARLICLLLCALRSGKDSVCSGAMSGDLESSFAACSLESCKTFVGVKGSSYPICCWWSFLKSIPRVGLWSWAVSMC